MIKNDNEFNPLREQKRMKMNFHLNKLSLFKNITFSLPLMYFHRWMTSVTCFFTSLLNQKNRQYAYFSKQNLSITSLSKKHLSITSPSYIDFGGKNKRTHFNIHRIFNQKINKNKELVDKRSIVKRAIKQSCLGIPSKIQSKHSFCFL